MEDTHIDIFKSVFRHSLVPSIIVKADPPRFTILGSNDQHKKATNSAYRNLIGLGLWEVFDPKDKRGNYEWQVIVGGLEKALSQKNVVRLPVFRYDILSTDGKNFDESYWKVEIIPIVNNDVIESLMAITHNVTQQQLVEKSLTQCLDQKKNLEENATQKILDLNKVIHQKSLEQDELVSDNEDRFKKIMETIPQITWTSRPDGSVSYYNHRWYEYTGLNNKEHNENIWSSLIHPEDLTRVIQSFSEINQKGIGGEFESRIKRADGTYRWHLNKLVPFNNSNGEVELWIGTATDIDIIKKIEKQKDDFISIASHELRTPLTALKVNLELMNLFKKDAPNEMISSLIDHSNKSIKRLTELIDDLLHTTKINEGKLNLKPRSFKLSDAVNYCCHPIKLLKKYNVTMEGDLSLTIEADEERISQVISNMVDNAIKHSRDSKDIIITISKLENKALVSVKDMGQGIGKDHLPHLFKKYYRADSTGMTNAGMGLGLYISAEIIKKHGGEIGVESEPQKGSKFWFSVPIEGLSLN